MFPSRCRCSSSWPSLFKQQKPCFCGRLRLVWEFAFFSSPPSSKHFVCLFFLNHRHIYINNTRDSLLGFPHLLPALNTKYVGLHIHACHLCGCLNSSYQQELDFIPSLYQSVLCRQKNPLQNTINNQQNSAVLSFDGKSTQTAGVILHVTTDRKRETHPENGR